MSGEIVDKSPRMPRVGEICYRRTDKAFAKVIRIDADDDSIYLDFLDGKDRSYMRFNDGLIFSLNSEIYNIIPMSRVNKHKIGRFYK